MQEKLELIIHVHKDAAMGYYTVKTLSEKLKDKDNKIKGFLEDIEEKYKEFSDKTKDILERNKINPEEEGFITKMMSSMGISKEVKVDNSDSAMADMVIQGISMGSIEMEKKINAYKDQIDKEYLNIAKDFLKFQQKTINDLKKFL